MKYILIYTLYLFRFLLTPETEIDFNLKKVEKVICNYWKSDEICMDELAFEFPMGKLYNCKSGSAYKGKIYVGRINSCRAGGCSGDYESEGTEEIFEYFDYLIIYNEQNAIELVNIFNYQASHGVEVTNKNWLKQFNGYAGKSELLYNKDIDAISGATVSVISLITDIEYVTRRIQLYDENTIY